MILVPRSLLVFLVLFCERYLSRDGATVLLKFLNLVLSLMIYQTFDESVIPISLATLRKKSGMERLLEEGKVYVVCPSCHFVYDEELLHSHQYRCDNYDLPHNPLCDAYLYCNVRNKAVPYKVFPYHSISSSIKRMMARPGFAELVEHWRQRTTPSNGSMYDVYDGDMWRQLSININGCTRPFVELPFALMLTLNVDWFQAFDRKAPYSVGAIYLTINNLPRSIRFKKENVILAGIIPGPHEPKKNQLNHYLR